MPALWILRAYDAKYAILYESIF